MPARRVLTGRSQRGIWPPWARRWGARMSRGYGLRRRARSSVRRMRCASLGGLQDGRRPFGRKRATEPAMLPGVNKAFGTLGSVKAAMDPGTVWVNGVVGEPEVIGPAGSVWVTRSGKEEPDDSPPSYERKGRPGVLGHESILELWLKVQAMRVASGCWEGSRVELHPVPAGEGPIEKGVPGRASWIETSRGCITGPWVRGHARTFARASGLPSARGIGAGCEKLSILRQGQAGKMPPAVGGPRVVKIDCAADGPWEERQTVGLPVAIGWSEAVKRSRAREVMDCGGTPGPCQRGQSVQVSGALAKEAVYGHTLEERGQVLGSPDALMVLPRAMEDETTSMGAVGLWQRTQDMEDTGSKSISGLRAARQSVGVPCAREEGARCGGDPGSWGTAQAADLSVSEEQESASQGVQGLWGIEQAMRAPRALGKEADDASVPGLWGTGQLPGLHSVVVPGDMEEETSYDVSGLWERQQALGAPLAEALPGPVMEKTHSGNLINLWERRQVIREQEGQGPVALGIPRAIDQDASCGALSCPCGRRRAMGVFETVGMPKHRCATERVPSALDVPAALGVCQESSSADVVSLQERTCVATGKLMAPEECSSVVEDNESGTPSRRRQAVGVAMAPEIPGSLEVEAGTRGFSVLSGRRPAVGIPVSGEVSPDCVGVAPRTSSSVWEHVSSRRVSDSAEGRPPTLTSMTLGLPGAAGDETLAEGVQRRQLASMPVAARIATAVGEPTASGLFGPHRVVDSACGESLGIWQRRQMTGLPTAAGAPKLEMDTGSEGVSGLWMRRSGTVPEVVRGPLHQEMLAADGVSMVGHVPAAVWMAGSPGEEADGGVADPAVVRRQPTEEVRASGEETGSRGFWGFTGRGQAVGMSCTGEIGARMWGSPRSVGEEITYENIPRVSAMRTVPSVSTEETGLGHFRDNLQGNEGRAVGAVSASTMRVNGLGERREGGLWGTFQ